MRRWIESPGYFAAAPSPGENEAGQAMTLRPMLRARHIRWRMLRMLDDVSATRVSVEAARHEVDALRSAVEQSRAQATVMASSLTRMEAELHAARQRQHELQTVLEATRAELQAQGRVLELLYEEESDNTRRLNELRRSPEHREAFSDEQ